MADNPAPRGRGAALLQRLKEHKEKQLVGIAPDAAADPPKCRGRAALLQKLQESKESRAGGSGEPAPITQSSTQPERRNVEAVTKLTEDLSLEQQGEVKHFRGTQGSTFRASANYIRLSVQPNRGVFEYEVRFQPDIDARSNRIKLVNQALGEHATTKVFDGDACLYLPSQIYSATEVFQGTCPNMTERIDIIITYKRKRRLGECLHLYNVLFKRIMHILLYTRMGRNYFSPDHKHLIPQHRLEVFPGYAVSVDEKEDGLMICLDTQHRVVRSQTVYELFHELNVSNPTNFKEFAMRQIIGSSVMTKYNNRMYNIDDIKWSMTPRDTFETSRNEVCSFVQYYKSQHNITIGDVDQPMLINKAKKSRDSNEEQLIALVPELCYLTGLTDTMRNDFKVMKDVAAFTRITPNQRMVALRSYLNRVRNSEMCQKVLGGWGLSVADGTIDLNARVLPAEAVQFGGGGTHCGSTDWSRAAGEHKVIGPVDLINWIVFYTQRDQRNAQNYVQTTVRLAKNMGCIIRDPRTVVLRDDRSETYMSAIKDNVNSETQVCVFICPTLRADRYSVIKKVLCCQMPCASQVILSKTLSNPAKVRTIIHKIAQQINCKLGGSLWTVKIPVSGWMVCGMDVYHGLNQPSVCGFVASCNDPMTSWFSEVKFQEKELTDLIKTSFCKALQQFRLKTGSFPSRIVMFRDGVGDGQLDHVIKYEVAQMEEVLQEMDIKAGLTFIIIQKRINTRIFRMTDSTNAENPPAGTVVDHTITRRNWPDFFLIPQSVRQGTVNPTHYIVVHDTADSKPDHLQRLAYKLCHLYYNWSGTIKVPAHCQYAHKLAGLVGQYIKKTPDNSLADKLYFL